MEIIFQRGKSETTAISEELSSYSTNKRIWQMRRQIYIYAKTDASKMTFL